MTRNTRWTVLLAAGLALAGAAGCDSDGGKGGKAAADPTASPPITVMWQVPKDLPADADLSAAAAFAWQEFIALNWPAIAQNGAPGTRDSANTTGVFGDSSYHGPLVWHTFRAKVEIFPAPGTMPQGYMSDSMLSYGYDSPRSYSYANPIKPYYPAQATDSVPWINLDENDEIGRDAMYAGVATGQPFPGDLILFMAKANRAEYTYVAGNQFFPTSSDSAATVTAFNASAAYVIANTASPPAGGAAAISLPSGTIEIKAGWRRLTPNEAASGRFYSTTVRFYRTKIDTTYSPLNVDTSTTYQDTVFGLVALHIIHKTPSRPYFVFATFEQADNLLDSLGNPVETENGEMNAGYDAMSPYDPAISDTNATAPAADTGYTLKNVQQISPATAASVPGKRVYFRNTASDSTTHGMVSLNRRVHPIPPQVVQANRMAHEAIAAYNQQNGLASSPWQYYKLINVQYQPIAGKQPGVNYSGPDSSNFYQANSVVESNYNLQNFSGMFQPYFPISSTDTVKRTGTITDWCATNAPGPGCTGNGPFYNVRYNGHAFNMGGCMGCHGNAQAFGGDFSFLMLGVNGGSTAGTAAPQLADPVAAPNDSPSRFFRFFRNVARPAASTTPAARRR